MLERGSQIYDYLVKFELLFATKFPFGRGDLDEKRATRVSRSECLRYYTRIAIAGFQDPKLILVSCLFKQRIDSFRNCVLKCQSNLDSETLGEKLLQLSQADIDLAAKCCLEDKECDNEVIKNLFSSIKGTCKSIGHFN